MAQQYRSENDPGNESGKASLDQDQSPKISVRPGADSWWWVATALGMAILLGLGSLQLIQLLGYVIALLVIGVAIAAGLAPVIYWLDRFIPLALAVILVYFTLVLIISGLVWITIPPLIEQGRQAIQTLPRLITEVESWFSQIDSETSISLGNTLSSIFSSISSSLLAFPAAIISGIAIFVFVIFISIYALIAAPGLSRFICSLFPEPESGRVQDVLRDAAGAMGGWMRGTAIDMVVVGVITYIGLLIIGFPFPLVMGVLTGVLELIPTLGPVIATVIAVGLSLVQPDGQVLVVLIFYIVLQQLENQILVPNIMRSQADVSPLLSIIAIFTGGLIGGLVGALAAIPIAAGLQVLVIEVVAPAVRRRTGAPAVKNE